MNHSQRLNYISGKLGLIPAFGDSIGRYVNKAELACCQQMAKRCEAEHAEMVAALKNAANVFAGLATGQLKKIDRDSPALAQIRAAIAKAEAPE